MSIGAAGSSHQLGRVWPARVPAALPGRCRKLVSCCPQQHHSARTQAIKRTRLGDQTSRGSGSRTKSHARIAQLRRRIEGGRPADAGLAVGAASQTSPASQTQRGCAAAAAGARTDRPQLALEVSARFLLPQVQQHGLQDQERTVVQIVLAALCVAQQRRRDAVAAVRQRHVAELIGKTHVHGRALGRARGTRHKPAYRETGRSQARRRRVRRMQRQWTHQLPAGRRHMPSMPRHWKDYSLMKWVT